VTNITRSKYKVSRRLSTSIWGNAKDAFHKRNYRPGQHGTTSRTRVSDYSKHLDEKQKLKSHYGRVNERQFESVFKVAAKMKGNTAENFIGLLERRLDMAIYRLNLAPTIFSARQLVSHKHIEVNNKIVNIPSFKLKNGDVISIKQQSKNIPLIIDSLKSMTRTVPGYLKLDSTRNAGTLISPPTSVSEVPLPFEIDMRLIVEYYSR
jgi:small subunit ribosomal protein S4